ncbi:hypothetical protein BC834DRAFT_819339, partial [Gloeopeniophorella convolvens]
IKAGYAQDTLMSRIRDNVDHHKVFDLEDGLLYTCNRAGDRVLCVPTMVVNKRRLLEVTLTQAHETLSHYGAAKTAKYLMLKRSRNRVPTRQARAKLSQ